MKTIAIKGETQFRVTAAPGGLLRLTHPVEATREITLTELVEEFEDNEGELRFVLPDTGCKKTLVASKDTRHGHAGWRASQYVDGTWDEHYLFFHTIEAVLEYSLAPTEELRRQAHFEF